MNKFLKFIKFSELTFWTAKRYFITDLKLTNKYPQVLFGKFLAKYSSKIINIEDEKVYKIIGVRSYGKGAYINREVQGQSLNMKKYQLVEPNLLLWCKVDTKNGAFGIVTENLVPSYASSNMALAKINNNLIANDYLQLLFTCPQFHKYLDLFVSGTTNRKYIKIDELLTKIKIPLPSLEKQKEIVDRYNEKIKLAEEQAKEAQNLEQEIDQYLCETLGIKIQNQLEQNKISYLNFTSLKKLSRWDVYNNKNQVLSTKYNFGKLKDIIIGKPLYGAGEKGINRKTDVRYIRITDINEDGSLNNDVISAENVDEKYLLKENDFLIARSGNTVGKTFLYKENFGKCIYAGYLIKFTLNLRKIIPEYLLYYTKSTAYKAWINSNQRANAQPNINSNEYLNSPIIIPEIQIQQKLVETISLKKEKIHNLKETSEQNRQLAQEEFEKELFE